MNIYDSINNIETASIVGLLLLMSGDVESNPGPVNLREHSVSIVHCNMRSIRNKLEYIIDHFCDFECLCFTETHLDNAIEDADIFLTTNFSRPYRKDRTNHGIGILVYINNNLIHRRRTDLEVFCEESIWVEIKINNQQYLLGTFYSPKSQDQQFFDALDRNIELALENSEHIIVVGDLNEDLLKTHYFFNLHYAVNLQLRLRAKTKANPERGRANPERGRAKSEQGRAKSEQRRASWKLRRE